ncbi:MULTISPECIES: amidase [unclassified Herbaspirillum]|uniref:amidase n=1 Tax=unclassified Herbaspirillum TaxID=2624150 RepID=UPI001151DE0D|nr:MULTISPECIES: amidase [unclassified Herbaspirillum]MBB5390600.1 aspartyl-tRNA(Asn)/glutamyl-tRNA(Gln) amidotransferase subunit A [Herbaspirillum sp. SJZ102]
MEPSAQMDAAGDLCRLGAAALADGYRRGAFTPVDAALACLARIEQCQPTINAMTAVVAHGALEAAHASARRWAAGAAWGVLDGIPLTVKDNLHVRGMPTTWGSRLYGAGPEAADELPVARLRAAGAVLLGKSNLPEFAMQGYTSNLRFGTTRNPWDVRLTPGGSSGGAAAAVASGCGPLALATDGGGSIRRPAAHCGLFGFKPSAGLVPRQGGLPEIFLEYESVGGLGRSVQDVRILMEVLAAQPLRSPPSEVAAARRILYLPRFAGVEVDPGIAANAQAVARCLSRLGHVVVEQAAFDLADAVNELWPSLSAAGLAWLAQTQPGAFEERCGAVARATLMAGRALPGSALYTLQREVMLLRRAMAQLWHAHDFILTPATAALPWAADEAFPAIIGGRPAGPRDHAVFTALANAAGLPAIAIPTGLVAGLPTGMQLIAPRGADAALLAFAEHMAMELPALGMAMPPSLAPD